LAVIVVVDVSVAYPTTEPSGREIVEIIVGIGRKEPVILIGVDAHSYVVDVPERRIVALRIVAPAVGSKICPKWRTRRGVGLETVLPHRLAHP
jgi:hypothetical protein